MGKLATGHAIFWKPWKSAQAAVFPSRQELHPCFPAWMCSSLFKHAATLEAECLEVCGVLPRSDVDSRRLPAANVQVHNCVQENAKVKDAGTKEFATHRIIRLLLFDVWAGSLSMLGHFQNHLSNKVVSEPFIDLWQNTCQLRDTFLRRSDHP